MKKRILFLMSDTGGGHRAAAQAITEAIHYLYPDTYDTRIEDIWKNYAPWPANRMPEAYRWLTGPGLPFWRLIWAGSSRFRAYHPLLAEISPLLGRRMVGYLEINRPDLVVSVHPLLNHLGLAWLRRAGLTVPFVTVVTDMVTVHPVWVCPTVTRCLVSTGIARERVIELGMPPHKVEVCGQPIGLQFATQPAHHLFERRRLGLADGRRTILLMGGGDGVGRVYEVARTLAQVPHAQLLIVAGRNRTLKERLERVHWEIPTRIYGFVDNIPDLMGAADVLVTKAGPGTLSEAFAAGLPPLIFSYIPGQERGNIEYVQAYQAGAYAATPAGVGDVVRCWLDPANDTYRQMGHNAAQLANPGAALTIATRLCALL